jgi:AmiR/NasT family two-component response regulator
MATDRHRPQLRILVANETNEDLKAIAQLALDIGEMVIATEMDMEKVGKVAADELPDVALVGLRESTDHALGMISEIVERGICPVIMLINEQNPGFVSQASKRGIYAYASPLGAEELRSAIDVALSRFEGYERLQGAMNRRGLIECAKGILMERYNLDRDQAFEMLRRQARSSGLKITRAAEMVLDGQRMLPSQNPERADDSVPAPQE